MKTMTRSEALQQGLRHYFTGKTCKAGHISMRFAKSGSCIDCGRLDHLKPERRQANRLSAKRSKEQNPERAREGTRLWRSDNKDRVQLYRRNYINRNLDAVRERSRKASRAARSDPRVKRLRAGYQRMREAMKMRAMPPWADRKAILLFYKNCPPGHHVDHIIPLKHPNVCGLHVLENLQYLPALENVRKRNSFHPEHWQ